jgi:hypothetical protein
MHDIDPMEMIESDDEESFTLRGDMWFELGCVTVIALSILAIYSVLGCVEGLAW